MRRVERKKKILASTTRQTMSSSPLISQGEISPPKQKRIETTPKWVWMLVGVMVVLGTINFVLLGTLYKAYTDEYAFFVNQGINFMYVVMGGMVLYPKQIFTNEINEKTGLRFPQRKLFSLGLLDSFGTLFTALGAVRGVCSYSITLSTQLVSLA